MRPFQKEGSFSRSALFEGLFGSTHTDKTKIFNGERALKKRVFSKRALVLRALFQPSISGLVRNIALFRRALFKKPGHW